MRLYLALALALLLTAAAQAHAPKCCPTTCPAACAAPCVISAAPRVTRRARYRPRRCRAIRRHFVRRCPRARRICWE